jgi:(1->4)-alpha-D-glucan 1-alpha-D-glucosylmutase
MRAKPSACRIPTATYRLQLHSGFGFAAAADIAPYLAALGVSHCYCSPYLKARPGSAHGYDIIDHDSLNPEIGSNAEFERFHGALREHGLGQVLDIVPNHMGVMGRDNAWWLDVLENGPASEFAGFFDIDWHPLRASLTGKVLLPVLHDHYGTVLESGELILEFDAPRGALALTYAGNLFPIDPKEYPRILNARLDSLSAECDDESTAIALQSLITAFGNLPGRFESDPSKLAERRRDKDVHKDRLAGLVGEHAGLRRYVEACVLAVNGRPSLMHALLEAQAYRLAYWRVASHEINYRRFFDINDLASLRMENPEVFERTHRFVLELVESGKLQGLRVDHPDGLFDPAQYFDRLRDALTPAGAPAGGDGTSPPIYVVAEKILSTGEELRQGWAVHGTTGYDFIGLTSRLFVYPNGVPGLDKTYAEFIGERTSFRETAYSAKKLIMETSLASELNVLSAELDRIAESDPHTRDFGLGGLRSALLEVIACLSVYRTYIASDTVAEADAALVSDAVAAAKRRTEAADTSVFDFLSGVLSLTIGKGKGATYQARLLHFVMKLQQYTGSVTAKGVEDTAFYRYNRFVSLNEVGSDPDVASLSVEAFHRANRERLRAWPHSMLGSSTHDSKRSADTRARISVLSELAEEWRARVFRWAEINQGLKLTTEIGELPDKNAEYLLYQTLLGVWPVQGRPPGRGLLQRLQAYMLKAVKEAKVHTSWINPDQEYEQAVQAFVAALFDAEKGAAFREDFLPFQARAARIGMCSSLSQLLLQLTVPGVPDIYQGTELWAFNLVDPDNRRAVDYGDHWTRLRTLVGRPARPDTASALMADLPSGEAKLHVMHKVLGLRRERPELFSRGDYVPLTVDGQLGIHLCAFARILDGLVAVVLAPRWFGALSAGGAEPPLGESAWKDTRVDVSSINETFVDLISGAAHYPSSSGCLEVSRALAHFPVAFLVNGALAQ